MHRCHMLPAPCLGWRSPHQKPVFRTRIQQTIHNVKIIKLRCHFHTLLHLVRIEVKVWIGALRDAALLPGIFFSFSESELITMISGFTLLFSLCCLIALPHLSAAARAARPLIRLPTSTSARRVLVAGC